MSHRWRSAEAAEYRKLYQKPRWKILRKRVLNEAGYICEWPGCHTPLVGSHQQPNAPVVHHKKDHKGDLELFYDRDNLQALCKSHHDQDAQRQTHRGYIAGHDKDGRPIDPDHPWNKGKAQP